MLLVVFIFYVYLLITIIRTNVVAKNVPLFRLAFTREDYFTPILEALNENQTICCSYVMVLYGTSPMDVTHTIELIVHVHLACSFDALDLL